jgi:hypothetical protein
LLASNLMRPLLADQKNLLEVAGADAIAAFVAADVFFGDVVVVGSQGLETAEIFLVSGKFHSFVVICNLPRW